MIDHRDPRHPNSGSPQAATLRRDGMYHLPTVTGVNTLTTGMAQQPQPHVP